MHKIMEGVLVDVLQSECNARYHLCLVDCQNFQVLFPTSFLSRMHPERSE